MAPTQPAVPHRSALFNPEAATFSPGIAKATVVTAGTGSAPPKSSEQSKAPVLGGEFRQTYTSELLTNDHEEGFRFRPTRNLRTDHRDDQEANVAYPLQIMPQRPWEMQQGRHRPDRK